MKEKSKDEKSKKSKESKVKKQDGEKSQKSASKSKGKQKSVTPPKGGKSKVEGKSKKGKDNQSQISSISQVPMPAADCIHHKSPFLNFCETCEQLVCSQCTVYGPHNNHLHRVLKMTDAYRLRKFYLVEAIRSNLVDKRDKIIAQLHRLEYRVEEIRFVKNIIERDIRSEYSGILERLKNHEGVKLAGLTHEVSLVQRQIDVINDLGNRFFELTSMECDKLEQDRRIAKYLSRSKEMYEQIEYIISKSDRHLPDLLLNQVPREVEQTRDTVKKALAAREINAVKNQILWKLLSDMRNEQNSIRKEVEERASGVIRELSQQVENLNDRLKGLRMVCCFCGVRVSEDALNTNCEINSSDQSKVQVQTQKVPEERHLGNSRHFFSRPLTN